MKAVRIKRKGRGDRYAIVDGLRHVATLRRYVIGGKRSGWYEELGDHHRNIFVTLSSAIRFYDAKKIDDRLFHKMESVL